jgi:hypothetical protein
METAHLVVRVPGAVHLFLIGEQEPEQLDQLIIAAKSLLEFPVGSNWMDAEWVPTTLPNPPPGRETVPAYDLSVSWGDPHGDLLKAATVHDVAELHAVEEKTVAAYRAAHADAVRSDQAEAVVALLAGLDDATVALIAAHPMLAGRLASDNSAIGRHE